MYTVTLVSGLGGCVDTVKKVNYIEVIDRHAYFVPEFSCLDPYIVEFVNLSEGADSVFWGRRFCCIST